VTYRPLGGVDLEKAWSSVIGAPIPDLAVYILDQFLQPVPVGVPGEMCIGGAGLGRGYLYRPDLTAGRFFPHPFSQQPGARLYRSGDLARYLPDGDIEYLGRIDYQVKIRGFRIELGEIEAVLAGHPALREAVVLAREDTPDGRRLVAYIVPDGDTAPNASELWHFLGEKLPEYMLPAAFVTLPALPLTPSGKVDRRALSAPERRRPDLEENYAPPSTPVEEVLVGIWAAVLGLEQIGINDNFFELGGDSILSIQATARANEAGLALSPVQVFRYQTVAELAAVVEETPAVRAEQGPVAGPVPFVPIQRWFFEQNFPDSHHFNQAILLETQPGLDPELLEKALQHLLVHHDALRLRFHSTPSGWQQVVAAPDEAVSFIGVDLSVCPKAEQGRIIETTSTQLQTSLDFSSGPLMRSALYNLGPGDPGRLLLIIHHLAVDGVSWRILLEDLQTVYQQLAQDRAIRLLAKTTSFQRWAHNLVAYAGSAELRAEADYWLAETQARVFPLPVDYPQGRGSNSRALADTVSLALGVEETRALLQKVPEVYHTHINDALLTALVQAFARWTGVYSLLVDLEGHGREIIFKDMDLSRTVGWFTALFPVLLSLENNADPGSALRSVKEQLRRIPNGGIGYGLLRYLGEDEEMGAQLQIRPQAEVCFNYLGQLDQVFAGSSLFRVGRESIGPPQSRRANRPYLLEINGLVMEGQLRMDWRYNKNLHRRSTIEGLAQTCLEALRSIILHCQSLEAGAFTPSDFVEFGWAEEELDDITAAIKRSIGDGVL
jgi:non-ribosomal peptide synthase protein (TIGR01720 family)